jgi:C-terminal processing protease CtpA/Prc
MSRFRRCESRARPWKHALLLLGLAALVAACGGGGSDGGSGSPSGGSCGETARKQWVLDVVRDWYLYPETLPASVDLAAYATAEELLDALTANARGLGKDRYFSYLTTRSAENSLFGEGEFVGFGFRNRTDEGNRVYVVDVFAASPAAEAGLLRGDEVIAVNGQPVADALAGGGTTFSDLLGPGDPGVSRTLTIRRGDTTFDRTMTKRTVTLDPIPDDFGTAVLPLAGTTGVGYLHLRTYVSTADAQLRTAFAQFRAQGLDYYVIDLRYNGGGLVSTAELIDDLLGGELFADEVQYRVLHNAARSNQDSTVRFQSQAQSVMPVRVAFLTTDATASASELNVNALRPYVEVAIVGSDTLGKPVGQIAFDLPGCDDRLRLVAFRTVNGLDEGDYYTGLAATMPGRACSAEDTLDSPLGSVDDNLTREAMAWLASGACNVPMSPDAATGARLKPAFGRAPPAPFAPTPAERWLPGVE